MPIIIKTEVEYVEDGPIYWIKDLRALPAARIPADYFDVSKCTPGKCGAVYLDTIKGPGDRPIKRLMAVNYTPPMVSPEHEAGPDVYLLLATEGPGSVRRKEDFQAMLPFIRACGNRLHKMKSRMAEREKRLTKRDEFTVVI